MEKWLLNHLDEWLLRERRSIEEYNLLTRYLTYKPEAVGKGLTYDEILNIAKRLEQDKILP